MIDKTLVRFLLVGLFNTVCGLSIIFYLKWALNFGDVSSNLIGYLLGFYISFYMHGRWTYKFDGALNNVILKYIFIVTIAYLCNLGTVLFLIEGFQTNSYFAQMFGIFPYVFVVYIGGKFIVFKNK